ncbi:MAG: pseudouridine synthase [Pseudomonadota bacterium]
MRLNVFLQRAGVGSRRHAEQLVAEGRVKVNGETALVTTPVNEGDAVMIDGKAMAIETRPIPRLFMLHKPIDYLVTTFDSQGRPTIYDLPSLCPPRWKSNMPRIMNVGRLDVNSEGLLLLSTDGPLAQAMMSPKMALERVYRVRVHGRLTPEQIDRLRRGVTSKGVTYRGAKVTEEKAPTGRNTWYQIILTEGKNREIRKLMEHFGCVVNRLIRLQYGPFKLGELRAGEVWEVPQHRVEALIDDLRKRDANADLPT